METKQATPQRTLTNTIRVAILALTMIASTLAFQEPADAATTYNFTNGAYNGTRNAATKAINEGACGGLSVDRLTALMLSIPVHEVGGHSATTNPARSPT